MLSLIKFKQVFFVIFNPIAIGFEIIKHFKIFLLKGFNFMMFFLINNIFDNGIPLTFGMRKGAIT